MSKVEDLLYEAHDEGIWQEVISECIRLRNLEEKYKRVEFGDRLEVALHNIRTKIKNENI